MHLAFRAFLSGFWETLKSVFPPVSIQKSAIASPGSSPYTTGTSRTPYHKLKPTSVTPGNRMAVSRVWFRFLFLSACFSSVWTNGLSHVVDALATTAPGLSTTQSTTSATCNAICQNIPNQVVLSCSIACLTPAGFASSSSGTTDSVSATSTTTTEECQLACTNMATQRCKQVCSTRPNADPSTFFPPSSSLPRPSSPAGSTGSGAARNFSLEDCQAGCSGPAQTNCLNSPMCNSQQNATVCESRCAAQLTTCNQWCDEQQSSWLLRQKIDNLVSPQQDTATATPSDAASTRLNRQSSSSNAAASPTSSSSSSSSSQSSSPQTPAEILGTAGNSPEERRAAIEAAHAQALKDIRAREAALNAARANATTVPVVNSTADPMTQKMQKLGFVYVCIDDPYAVEKVNAAKKQEATEVNRKGQSVSQLRQVAQQQIAEGEVLKAKLQSHNKKAAAASSKHASTPTQYEARKHAMVTDALYERAAAKAAYYESFGNPNEVGLPPHVQHLRNGAAVAADKPVKTLNAASLKKYCGEQCATAQKGCLQRKASESEEKASPDESEASRKNREQNQHYRDVSAMYQCQRLKQACEESCSKSLDYIPVPTMPEHLRAPQPEAKKHGKHTMAAQEGRYHRNFHSMAAEETAAEETSTPQAPSASEAPDTSSSTVDVSALPPLASEIASQNILQICQWVTKDSAQKAGLVWKLPNGELSNSTAADGSTSSTASDSSSSSEAATTTTSSSSDSSSSSTSSSTATNKNKNQNQNQNKNKNQSQNQKKSAKKASSTASSGASAASTSTAKDGRIRPMQYPDLNLLKTDAEREAAHAQFIAARNAAIKQAKNAKH